MRCPTLCPQTTVLVVFGCIAPLNTQIVAEENSRATDPSAITPVSRPSEFWREEFNRLNDLIKQGNVELVFLGDELMAGWADEGQEAWSQFFSHRNAVNLGIVGDHTEHILWRIENGNLDGCHPNLIVLSVGANNLAANLDSTQQTIDGISAVVNLLQAKLPKSQILLLGLFSKADTNNPQAISIAEANRIASQLADWEQLHFLDVGHALADADNWLDNEDLPNGCSLSPDGYRRLADAIDFKIAELLGEPNANRIELFDGESLEGWQAGDEEGAPKGWSVVDGSMAIVERGDDAQSTRNFRNFDLQCEWKLEHRSNSGVFYRWADYGGIVSAGPEYQIIDDVARRLPRDRVNSTAATVDMYGPDAGKPVRETGRWNHTRIVANGNHVEHWLNGIRVLSFELNTKDWRKRLAKSKFRRLRPFGLLREGAIRLQNYGGMPVYYRDIKVETL